MHKVVGPDMIGTNGTEQPHIRSATPSARPAARQTQPQLSLQPFNPSPAFVEPDRAAAIAKSRKRLRGGHQPAGRTFRQPPTRQTLQRLAPTSRGTHFFAENSFKPSITSSCSATNRLSLAFSFSRTLSLRASGTSMPPYLLRQRKKVCSVMLLRRQTSRICTPGDSASRSIRITCSSVNRFFICKPPIKSYHRTHSLFGRKFRTQVKNVREFRSRPAARATQGSPKDRLSGVAFFWLLFLAEQEK